ncbi:MAG: ECF transporter S component [Promethearchaeota archaeon]
MKILEPDSINLDKEPTDTEEPEGEIGNQSVWLERNSFRLALISTFSALSIVLGYMLVYLPNIELLTLMIFLSGFIMGKKEGLIVGLISSFIYFFFNPNGASPLPLLAFQVFFYLLIGLIGGFSSHYLSKKKYFKPDKDLYTFQVIGIFGIIGGFLTFSYDILSTAVGWILFSSSGGSFLITLSTGIIFTIVHLIGNILGFIFILPGLIQLVYKMLY